MAETKCVCGHVEDEHSQSSECQVDWCLCGYWNPAGSPGRGKSRYGESMELKQADEAMVEFSDDYIDLCRKLALPREWRPGDIYAAPQGVGYELPTREVELVGVGAWLPREGDLLDLLEAEGVPCVTAGRDRRTGNYSAAIYDDATFEELGEKRALDRKTALLKLLVAAKGTDNA